MLEVPSLSQVSSASITSSRVGLSIVIALRNQDTRLSEYLARLTSVIGTLAQDCEVILVDDGSTDNTWSLMSQLPLAVCEFHSVRLSRRFGFRAAILAGLERARGLAVITLNADLLDPPELIPQMLKFWGQGYEVVHMRDNPAIGAREEARPWLSRLVQTFREGWQAKSRLSLVGFRLMSRQFVDCINELAPRQRLMKDIFKQLGFAQMLLEFDGRIALGEAMEPELTQPKVAADNAEDAALATKSNWLSITGGVIAVVASLFTAFSLFKVILLDEALVGYPILVIIQVLLIGLQLIALVAIGGHINNVMLGMRTGPLYLVEKVEQKLSLSQKQKMRFLP